MDFEQYLERDILKFLDSKIQKAETKKIDREEEYGLYLTRDYLKELNYALDNDELTKAKKLFDELKKTYSKLPKTSFERKKIYTLLEKMYAKIQNYVDIKEGKIEVIKQGDSEILKVRNQSFLTESKTAESVQKAEQEADKFDTEPIYYNMIPIGHKTSATEREVAKDDAPKKDSPVETNILGNIKEDFAKKSEKEDDIIEKLNDLRNKMDEKSQEQNKKIDELRKEIMNQINDELKNKNDEKKLELKTYDQDYDKTKAKTFKHFNKISTNKITFSNEELRIIYEQAIYCLFDEKYEEAAKLFSKITRAQSENKAARIRLQECVEHMPELAEKYPEIKEVVLYSSNKTDVYSEKAREDIKHVIGEGITDLEYEIKKIEGVNKDHNDDPKPEHIKKKYEDNTERLKKIYDHGILVMAQQKYEEAAKVFKQILRIRPSNKAAKIKLQECLEAIGNA